MQGPPSQSPLPQQRKAGPAPRASMGLLLGVGLAFLVVGAMLAVIVMKFVR